MRCKKCNGTGEITVPVEEHMGTVLYGTEQCDECDGAGEVLTNEEYIQTCTTEQLAERIISLCVTYFDRTDLSIVGAVKESLKINDHYDGHIQKDLLVEWLKQPHSEVGK